MRRCRPSTSSATASTANGTTRYDHRICQIVRLLPDEPKGGAATAALIGQRRGAVFAVGVQPTHHGLWVAACAHRHLRSAGAFSDLVQSQETLAAAGMRGIEGQLTQIRLRLAPTVVVNL